MAFLLRKNRKPGKEGAHDRTERKDRDEVMDYKKLSIEPSGQDKSNGEKSHAVIISTEDCCY